MRLLFIVYEYWFSEAGAVSVAAWSITRCLLAVFPFLDEVLFSSSLGIPALGVGEGTRRRQGTFGKYLVDMSHFKSNDLPICYLFPWSLLGLRTAGKQPSSLREYLCHS